MFKCFRERGFYMMTSLHKSILVISIMMLATLAFSGLVFSNTYSGGHGGIPPAPDGDGRKPVGPVKPPVDVKEPACPTDFDDSTCSMVASGMGKNVAQVWGAAALACDAKLPGCQKDQTDEMNAAKAKCEAVKGCVFGSSVDYDECGENNAEDCNPPATSTYDPMKVTFMCKVEGEYNITDYECDRPDTTAV